MKKRFLILLIVILICILFPLVYYIINITRATDSININLSSLDSKTFKYEYESLNDTLDENGEYKYIPISIAENNKFKYVSYEKLTSIIEGKTGVIYLGFPECPWCRRVLPILSASCEKYKFDSIYYYNALDIRDEKHLNSSGEIVEDKAGDEKYYKLISLLKDYIGEYKGLNDSSIKRIYFPTIIFVKDGVILGVQISATDSYTNAKEEMTSSQKNELEQIFDSYLEKMYEKIPNDECSDTKGGC